MSRGVSWTAWLGQRLGSIRITLTVKFRDDVLARPDGVGLLTLGPHASRQDLDAVVQAWSLTFVPLFSDATAIEGLRARAETRTGHPAVDLLGIYRVEGPALAGRLLDVALALDSVSVVQYVYLQGSGWAPPGDIPPTTKDWEGKQTWRGTDPGIDVDFAADLGVRGAAVGLADCEYAWNGDHEDLMDGDLGPEPGQTPSQYSVDEGFDQHGTAAIGELVAGDNGYGAVGAAPDVHVTTWSEYTEEDGERRVDAIANAVAHASVGDVVMLEMQAIPRAGADADYAPAETDPDVFEVVQTATDAGIIVVAAAGNGSQDLDADWYEENYLAWGDSGALIVGAGGPDTSHEPEYFTTYGSRVNLQGWGDSVFTLGYGDAREEGGDINQAYTEFSGTSSATPMVAAAVVLVQDFLLERAAQPMDAWEMRDLLVATGVPQGDGVNIGPLPDLAAALSELDSDGDDHVGQIDGGDDCNDSNPLMYPGSTASEPKLKFDANCDGHVQRCGCSGTAGTSGGSALLGLSALVLGRRREQRTPSPTGS